MDLLEQSELKEGLYSRCNAIVTRVSAAQDKINAYGSVWSTTRGDLFSIIALLKDVNNYINLSGNWEKKLKEVPINLTTFEIINGSFIERLTALAKSKIEDRYYTPTDEKISTLDLYNEIWNEYNQHLPLLGKFMDKQIGFPLSRISESLSNYNQFFSGNWAVAAVHLVMMDSAVNRLSLQLGFVKDSIKYSNEPFQMRYSALKDYLHEKGIEMDPGVNSKATTLWTLRTEVVHNAMNPDNREVAVITSWSRTVIDNLFKAREELLKVNKEKEKPLT